MYAPVRDTAGVEKAYLNIPYFNSQSDLNQEISNFIVTVINLNAFIFLIAGLIALFIIGLLVYVLMWLLAPLAASLFNDQQLVPVTRILIAQVDESFVLVIMLKSQLVPTQI